MSSSTEKTDRTALEKLFADLLDKKGGKADVESCKPWLERVTPEEVVRLVDGAIRRDVDIPTLKPAVSKILNLAYDSLRRHRYQESPDEFFLRSLIRENRGAVELLSGAKAVVASLNAQPDVSAEAYASAAKGLHDFAKRIGAIEIHYRKKENILFPRFEARFPDYRCLYIMWSIHDDVRRSIRRLLELTEEPKPLLSELNGEIGKLYFNLHAVVFREEHIVFPLFARVSAQEELNGMFAESADFGFCFLSEDESGEFLARARELKAARGGSASVGSAFPEYAPPGEGPLPGTRIELDAGRLSPKVLDCILKTVPVDMTFVDSDGRVVWFSNSPHRIFPRSPSILGRDVRNCHPRESVDRVESILDAFREGTRDRESFWIRMKGRFIHIEYFALRDSDGSYLGTLEVSQDLTEKRALEGEKRLADGL